MVERLRDKYAELKRELEEARGGKNKDRRIKSITARMTAVVRKMESCGRCMACGRRTRARVQMDRYGLPVLLCSACAKTLRGRCMLRETMWIGTLRRLFSIPDDDSLYAVALMLGAVACGSGGGAQIYVDRVEDVVKAWRDFCRAGVHPATEREMVRRLRRLGVVKSVSALEEEGVLKPIACLLETKEKIWDMNDILRARRCRGRVELKNLGRCKDEATV